MRINNINVAQLTENAHLYKCDTIGKKIRIHVNVTQFVENAHSYKCVTIGKKMYIHINVTQLSEKCTFIQM